MANNKKSKIVVTAFVYNNGKVLIIKRSPNEEFLPNVYELPGGKVDFGENPEIGLMREVKEEVGIDICVEIPVYVFDYMSKNNSWHNIEIAYICTVKGKPDIKLSKGHTSYKWIKENEVEKYNITHNIKDLIYAGFKKHLLKVSVDGISGSHKFDVCSRVAKNTGLYYVNAGLIYRGIVYCAIENGISIDKYKDFHENNLFKYVKNGLFKYKWDEAKAKSIVLYKNNDITQIIMTHEHNKITTKWAAIHSKLMDDIVRQFAANIHYPGFICAGKGISKYTFPDSQLKIFFIADPEDCVEAVIDQDINIERKSLNENNIKKLQLELMEIDDIDSKREFPGLELVEGVNIIDTSIRSKSEALMKLESLIRDTATSLKVKLR